MKTSLTILLLFWFSTDWAQQIQINEDPAVSRLMSAWADLNRSKPAIVGWRVQIFSSTDRKLVEDAKAKFRSQFPEIRADWTHEKPYYKLRAGAFRTKMEAMSLIGDLKTAYPGAYAARDNAIHPREFLE